MKRRICLKELWNWRRPRRLGLRLPPLSLITAVRCGMSGICNRVLIFVAKAGFALFNLDPCSLDRVALG